MDNLVYRLGFASSIRMARQMVSHKHFLVDGKKVNIPSYNVKVGSTISLDEKSRKSEQFKKTWFDSNVAPLDYLERDADNFSGKLVSYPQREKIPVIINEQMVVELFSK